MLCSNVLPGAIPVRGWQMATASKLGVVVAQYGADVAVCLAAQAEGPSEIVQQASEETAGQLMARVRERLADLTTGGARIQTASFVARKGFDVRDVMAAAGVLRGLVSTMVAAGTAQVHLHAEPSDLQTRYALTALAEAMSEQLEGTGVEFVTHLSTPADRPQRRAEATLPR
jgi:hypothetical protein